MPTPEPRLMEVTMRDHPLIMETILNSKWAIKPETFELILSIVQGNGDEKQAATLRASRLSNEPRQVDVLGQGTAVIPIIGPIVPRASFFSEVSGLVDTQSLQKDFAAALDDPTVKSILLNVDSPGGAVTGISELSQMIFEARKKKPVYAYVQGMGASAAYWIASAATKMFASPTSELGSIGVVATYRDYSKLDAKSDVQTIEIVSSISPKKRTSPTTDAGRAEYQAIIDDLAQVMVNDIARNRGVSPEGVISGFGEGFVLIGQKAVDRKMADGISTFENVLAQLNPNHLKGAFTMSGPAGTEAPKTYTAEELETAKQAEFQKGVVAERKRIQDIEAVKAPGHESLVAELKYKDGMTAASVALAVLEAQETKRAARVNAEQADAALLASKGKGAGLPASGTPTTEAEQASGLSALIAKGGNARRIHNEPARAA